MDKRFVTVMGVSLLFALVVSGVFYQISRGGSSRPAGPQQTKDLVVTTKPLAIGSVLKADDVRLVKIADSAFPKGGFSKVEEVIDRPIMSNILLEEPVLEGRLAAKGAGSGLAPVIPIGMRAVSLRITDVVGVAGFVQPGLRVDVLVTGRPPKGDSSMTTTVLQDILVLGAGAALVPDARGQAMTAQSVTVLVTPEQAEILALATHEGRIQLVLRNSKDREVKATPGSSVQKLYAGGSTRARANNGEDAEEAAEPSPRPRVRTRAPAAPRIPFTPKLIPQAPPDQIIVIRGDKRTTETVLPAKPGSPENEEKP